MTASVWWLTLAMMGMPLSIAGVFWGDENHHPLLIVICTITFWIGFIFWVKAWYEFTKEQKIDKKNQNDIASQNTKNIEALDRILNELKVMKDERERNTKQ